VKEREPGGSAVALLSVIVLAAVLVAAEITVAFAAGTEPGKPPSSQAEQPERGIVTGLANPAAVFCIKSGGTYSIRKAADDSEYGVCVFPGGPEIDAWEFFRAHAPKD
jgi:putative hemolysin